VGDLIEKLTAVRCHEGHVRRVLGKLGFSCQRPERRAVERDDKQVRRWRRKVWPGLKKNAGRQGRVIVFVDESGLSIKPTRARTWAPRGQTPWLFESFNWKRLSVIGGLSLRRFYFQIHKGSIKSAQVIEFIKHLQRHLKRRLLIIWDGAAIHRSKEVQA
jgi:hypothetical protein